MRKMNGELSELSDETIMQHANEWLNDHGQPSEAYLKKLVENDTIEARDQILELADQYNVVYDSASTSQEIVERIKLFMNLGSDPV